jgi:hypothetical protein
MQLRHGANTEPKWVPAMLVHSKWPRRPASCAVRASLEVKGKMQRTALANGCLWLGRDLWLGVGQLRVVGRAVLVRGSRSRLYQLGNFLACGSQDRGEKWITTQIRAIGFHSNAF